MKTFVRTYVFNRYLLYVCLVVICGELTIFEEIFYYPIRAVLHYQTDGIFFFNQFIFYTMIYKFLDLQNQDFFVEFFKCESVEDTLTVQVTGGGITTDVDLNKEQLFELIGGLLRIQSKMSK